MNDSGYYPEPVAEVVPDRDAEFVTGFDEPQESIAAITAGIASCPGADLASRDLTADVVLGSIGVERNFRPLQHHQQLRLVGM